MSLKLAQTTNADCYFEGVKVGYISEFTPDAFEYEAVTHEALGMIGKLELPSRTLNPLKAKINFEWLDADVLAKTAIPNKAMTFQFHQYIDVFDQGGLVETDGYRLVTTVSVLFASSNPGSTKNGESTGVELDCSIMRYESKSTKSETLIREISVLDGINRVNGVDVWPVY